jgi:molecular chaperone DnaK
MIFQTDSQLKEFGDKIPDDKKKTIEDALDVLKKAHESKDIESIKTALEGINEAWKNASEELYKAQAEAQQASGAGNTQQAESTEKPKDDSDDVQDVDFEEVK